jgi:hypothetical protein
MTNLASAEISGLITAPSGRFALLIGQTSTISGIAMPLY